MFEAQRRKQKLQNCSLWCPCRSWFSNFNEIKTCISIIFGHSEHIPVSYLLERVDKLLVKGSGPTMLSKPSFLSRETWRFWTLRLKFIKGQ